MHRPVVMNNSLVSVATFVGIGGFSALHTDENMRPVPLLSNDYTFCYNVHFIILLLYIVTIPIRRRFKFMNRLTNYNYKFIVYAIIYYNQQIICLYILNIILEDNILFTVDVMVCRESQHFRRQSC